MLQEFTNPIISGFNPDPSICRVGEDFYLVTSTFEYFPGVPVYKSKNLVNWECIGHCLNRESQLPLRGCGASGGIYAPTIRYHEGTFFMVTTNVSGGGNFIVHTKDPAGSWSQPAWVKQGGIDPSLLFEDGRVYFVSNGDDKGNGGIYLCEADPFTGEMLTESRLISRGCGGKCPEAPHLYKIKGKYYLMLAEGGTEYGHMVTIQRSDSPYGPFEKCPWNPILSHRDTADMSLVCTGHADMTEDQNGNWWLVALGVRTISGQDFGVMLHNLGRETFLAPVAWKDGWPVVGNNGRFSLREKAELPAPVQPEGYQTDTAFNKEKLGEDFTWVRNPKMSSYRLCRKKATLVITGDDTLLSEEGASPAFVGIRQKDFEMHVKVTLSAAPSGESQKAGLSVFYNHDHHYDIYLSEKDGRPFVGVRKKIYDLEAVTKAVALPAAGAEEQWKAAGETEEQQQTAERLQNSVTLHITADKEYYRFYYEGERGELVFLDKGATAAMCTEITRRMTFTGTFIGMFCENVEAEFSDFCLVEEAR